MIFPNPFHKYKIDDFNISKYRKQLLSELNTTPLKSDKYQVVILAAGHGKRMGLNYPKILYKLDYPTGSTSLLNNTLLLINSLKNKVDINKVHLLINKKTRKFYKEYEDVENINILELEDRFIKGTAICINTIKSLLDKDRDIIFLWGDLALWRLSDLFIAMQVHTHSDSFITFPTRIKVNPYVAFLRSNKGEISEVMHANESEQYQGIAEQDCLTFICKYDSLLYLDGFISEHCQDLEVDFIHFIPYLAIKGIRVVGLPIVENNVVYGLNTPERVKEVNRIMSRYKSDEYSFFSSII
jgi:bifunctional N-acetylglucosamine-1-phosphate-uridyltransferase/glucosamine-1-phosphate-acetyltransferase GlmU-like protein